MRRSRYHRAFFKSSLPLFLEPPKVFDAIALEKALECFGAHGSLQCFNTFNGARGVVRWIDGIVHDQNW